MLPTLGQKDKNFVKSYETGLYKENVLKGTKAEVSFKKGKSATEEIVVFYSRRLTIFKANKAKVTPFNII